MLFVDDDDSRGREVDAFLDQGVRPDDETGVAGRDPLQRFPPRLPGDGAGQEFGLHAERAEHLHEGAPVLLRQQFRRGHDRRLPPRLDRLEHGERGHDRLPASHIPLQQAVHRRGAGHVRLDPGPGAALGRRELEGEGVQERAGERGRSVEGDAADLVAEARPGPGVEKLEKEEFLEGEAPLAAPDLGDGGRAMQGAKGLRERGEGEFLEPAAGNRVVVPEVGEETGEVQFDDGADLSVREPLGGGIDGKHPPRGGTLPGVRGSLGGSVSGGASLVGGAGQHGVFARLELLAVVEAHGSGGEQQVALVDRAVEPRASRPRALDVAARVAEHGAEDAQPAPRGDDALRDHAPDDRRILTDLQPGDRVDRGRVLVPVREVVEEILSRVHVELREALRPPGAHALQVLHGSPQDGAPGRHAITAPVRGSCRDTARERTPRGPPGTPRRRGSGRERRVRARRRRRCRRAPCCRTSRARGP